MEAKATTKALSVLDRQRDHTLSLNGAAELGESIGQGVTVTFHDGDLHVNVIGPRELLTETLRLYAAKGYRALNGVKPYMIATLGCRAHPLTENVAVYWYPGGEKCRKVPDGFAEPEQRYKIVCDEVPQEIGHA